MNSINKQKFLTELGRLLTFMYEEDRQTALDMYARMFDDAKDEQSLLHFLVSPTRQAVVLARTYNAKERKLQVHAQPKSALDGQEPEALPEFILAIDQIQQEAAEAQGDEAPSQVPADQFTLFADNVHPQATETQPPERSEAPAQAESAKPAEEPAPVEAAPPAIPAETPAPEEKPADKVEAFVEDFAIKDEQLFPESEEKEQPPQEPVKAELKPVRKPKVFLLILYIILAIPVSVLVVALLLLPTLLFLALSGTAVVAGSLVLAAAFSGFAVFADIMVVLGGALVILALGLLLLWVFVWFIGGPIVGFINSVIRLGGKWCYKEVLAE